ncbi:DoxX family membrane protein [Sagittula sp. SSi028]|uniref:DoxX family membrane protein n=1 Tax=Sagittula sp. SSi028 TaxID=3400636 RepID=UPI003AF6C099
MIALYTSVTRQLDRIDLSLMARIVFAATLAGYFWKSAATKLFDRNETGLADLLSLNPNVYAQIFPKAFEAAGYDPSALSGFHALIAWAGTLAEYVLPLLIIIGLLTRLAALGMIGFVIVQTATDIWGHGATAGALFDGRYQLLDERSLWIALFLVLVFKGGGLLSIDRAAAKRLSAY